MYPTMDQDPYMPAVPPLYPMDHEFSDYHMYSEHAMQNNNMYPETYTPCPEPTIYSPQHYMDPYMEEPMDNYMRCPMMDPMVRHCVAVCMRQCRRYVNPIEPPMDMPMEVSEMREMLPEEINDELSVDPSNTDEIE
ncbi:hypothetical protein FYJ27_07330 [Anaerosalibacter bizertensis]|uniref:Uncharacterized protein n=1 Tax=Anaerosalibacter bizertensis TaxID=932217 RepID=A0A844FHJ2_9FIRM|nr:hypothetical protein [Anaerosalibacter bizertensis]MBU5294267.1 hypothetical protein [Anaerosalibacter bizertensis]MSS43537.1 hypothetical protein [Anaerosalibacter bizertensis]